MWKNSVFTSMAGIDYPIVQAGMAGGVTTPELVAAVSSAGGLGTLGAGYMNAESMEKSIQKIKSLTSATFGVNLFIPEYPEIDQEELQKASKKLNSYREELGIERSELPSNTTSSFKSQLELVLKYRVPVCSFTFGVPDKEVVQELKREDILVIGTATTVQEAVVNEENGVDVIVAQGSEAGGHRGSFLSAFDKAMIGTISLVPQVVDEVNVPVIAAGGIMDGRGLLAACALGAQGVQMGTAFVTSLESGAKEPHKQAILHTTEEKTVITSAFSGKPARGIENQFIRNMKSYEGDLPAYPLQNSLTKDIRKEAANQNKPEYMSLWSGQSPRLSQQLSASAIVEKAVAEAEQLMKRLS
ncbi:nitronate monooxygenase family protein [Halobacillus sp. Marseille-Q1614]|uniref:NAD(P)H-dependent flavin oxidoreductase n=1 Tax=Halobacillus sp. Marseille-Q1614 TaxID=2709134 RepID=UPI00156F6F00|nr:nitronate monooxygenase [Halobacillus sp. Marseille-Q1614]